MKPRSLETLARLRRQDLMALNRNMAAAEDQQAQLQAALDQLEAELETEALIALGDPFAQFGGYSVRHGARTDKVVQELDRIDAEIVNLHDLIATAFEAYKVIGQVQDAQQIARAAQAKRFEQAAMDDTVSQSIARRETAI